MENKSKAQLTHKRCLDNFWHLVGYKLDIPKKNSYKCINLGKYKLFLYNYNDEIKVYLNVCPHEGPKYLMRILVMEF